MHNHGWLHRSQEPWTLTSSMTEVLWLTGTKETIRKPFCGGDNAWLWRKYHPTMCCWATLFDDCKRRGWALIHAQAQNAGNADEQHIENLQSSYWTTGNGRIYVMNTTWRRSDADLGDECIDLQHGARGAELLNPTSFPPLYFSTPGRREGVVKLLDRSPPYLIPSFIKTHGSQHHFDTCGPQRCGELKELYQLLLQFTFIIYNTKTSHFIDLLKGNEINHNTKHLGFFLWGGQQWRHMANINLDKTKQTKKPPTRQ